MMKVLICNSPGDLTYRDLPKPTLTKDHALLKIKRIGICGTDLHAFEGTQPYFNYPRILGHEIAAEVEDVDGKTDFSKGEAVTFLPYFSCAHCVACKNGKPNCCTSLKVCGVHIDGGMAEFLSVPANSLVSNKGLGLDALALVEPLSIGAHAVKRANIRQGEFVLVVGAGPIGLGTMEFARLAGGRVIALDINESRLKFISDKLNIKHTINGQVENVSEKLRDLTNGDMPTVVIDATGSLKAIEAAFPYMAHGARYVLVGLQKGNISFSHPEFHKREATLMSSRNATREDFEFVIHSLLNRSVDPTTYITHRLKFDQAKDEFHRWLNPASGVIKAMVEVP